MQKELACLAAFVIVLLALPAAAQPDPEKRLVPAQRYGRLDDHPLIGDRSVVMPGQNKDWIAIDRGYLPTRDDDRLGSGSIFNEYRR